jgi:hypothetical protein
MDTGERDLIAPSGLSEEQQSALSVDAWSHPKSPAANAPRLSIWAALGNALLTLVGVYRY